MLDFNQSEEIARQLLQPRLLTRPERERLELLEAIERERPQRSPRRWLAARLVELGLSLDPEIEERIPVRVRA